MARGATLTSLVTDLRAEIGHSISPSVGQEKLGQLKRYLARHQETLYTGYDWPHMIEREGDKALAAGQRYYDFPSTVNPDRVLGVSVRWGNQWIPVNFGIDTERQYNVFDPSETGDRNDPVQNWDWYDDGGQLQFEVWPTPASAGTIRFRGVKPLSPLSANSDTADLDSNLIVLYAAAEMMQGMDGAKAKESLANDLLRRLKGNSSKRGPTGIGADHRAGRGRQPVTIRIAGA
jgi:hypothetical protein